MEKIKAEADAVADRMETLLASEEHDLAAVLNGKPGVIEISKGRELVSVKKFADEYRETPERRKGTSTHKTVLSLIEFTNRFKSDHSVLFADPGLDSGKRAPVLQVVLNYNPAGGEPYKTGWGDHRGRYAFPMSEQWEAWKSFDGKPMDVATFAAFIERQIEDIADPSAAGGVAKQLPERLGFKLANPSEVLNLSKGLSLVVGNNVSNVVDPGSGERKLQFETKHTDAAGKPLEVLKAFLLLIPVFQAGTVYSIGVRLTYAVHNGQVLFTYYLYREDLCFKDAFELACEEARSGTQLPLYFGTPE